MGVKVKERVPGSGVWWLFINHNGHRKAKRVGSQEAANVAAKKIEARLTLGETALPVEKAVEKAKPTVEEYYKAFEATHMATAIRPSTARQYRINFRVHILPELGKIPVDQLSRERVKSFVAHLCGKKATVKAAPQLDRSLSKKTPFERFWLRSACSSPVPRKLAWSS